MVIQVTVPDGLGEEKLKAIMDIIHFALVAASDTDEKIVSLEDYWDANQRQIERRKLKERLLAREELMGIPYDRQTKSLWEDITY